MMFQSSFLAALFALILALPSRAQHLDVVTRHRIVLTYDCTVADGESGRFYLPIPPDTGSQKIESFTSSWSGTTISGDSPGQRLLTGHVPSRHWRVRIVGTFTIHELNDGPASTPPPASSSAGSFTGTSDSLDWKSDSFQSWLDSHDLRRGKDERAVAYSRRLFNYLVDHGEYSYPPEGGWVASRAARYLSTDCGGFSLIFVAACRANHVPARLLVGQWLKTRSGDELAGRQAHVIAQFYDAGIGWVPVDLSSALMHVNGRSDYFGREPGYFFAWHYDTDFHFDVPGGANGHVQWIQNPAPWFANGEDGGSRSWTVELQ